MKSFNILTKDGHYPVAGYIVGHLGIHKDYDWRITHIGSGKQIAYGFDKLAEAKTFAESLQQLVDLSSFNDNSVIQLANLRQALKDLERDK